MRLREFCTERFGWHDSKADELLLPVLKAYDERQVQCGQTGAALVTARARQPVALRGPVCRWCVVWVHFAEPADHGPVLVLPTEVCKNQVGSPPEGAAATPPGFGAFLKCAYGMSICRLQAIGGIGGKQHELSLAPEELQASDGKAPATAKKRRRNAAKKPESEEEEE